MKCKNCGHLIDGNFCAHCGQKSNINRINISSFLKELSESFFQINKGFFYTLKELFVRPGASLKDFLNGKRKSHFKPFSYLILLSTVYFLISKFTNHNTLFGELVEGWMIGANEKDSNAKIPEVANWFLQNYTYLTLLLVPVFSLASYISFLKFRINYLEHIVLNAYVTGHQAIFYALFAVGHSVIENDAMEVLPVIVSVSYTLWVFWRFFSEGNRVMNILRTILTYILYFTFSLILLGILMGINEL